MKSVRVILLLVVVALLAFGGLASGKGNPTVVILVRHAEKEKNKGDDPPLSDEGRARAARLADVLARSDLSAILTSQYERTKQTAGPVAEKFHVTPESITLEFDRKFDAMSKDAPVMNGPSRKKILDWVHAHEGKTMLIIGHSNTVPDVIEALGGPTVTIDETKFDDLFILTLGDKPILAHLTY